MSVLLTLLLAAPAMAHLGLQVTADHDSKVYIDRSYVGQTPLTLDNVQLGTHTLTVRSALTGEARSYEVVSSRVADTSKNIHVDFGGRSSRHVRSHRDYAPRPVVVTQPLYSRDAHCYDSGYPTGGYGYGGGYRAPYSGGGYSTGGYGYGGGYSSYGGGYGYASPNRDSHRFRNVLLGAGVVNEVFNRGNSRGDIRKGVVGAALLNELVRGSSGGGGGGGLFGF